MSETLTLVSPIITASDLPAPAAPGPYRVVMVCTGNICRSAMAGVVLADRLAAAGVPVDGPDGVLITSGGVSDEEAGNPVDRRARRVLEAAGYGTCADEVSAATAARIAAHSAHRVSDREMREADLLLAMTSAHRRELLRRADRLGVAPERIEMFRAFDPAALEERRQVAERSSRHYSLDVPDPWYGTSEDFVATLEVVERVSDALAPALVELAAARR